MNMPQGFNLHGLAHAMSTVRPVMGVLEMRGEGEPLNAWNFEVRLNFTSIDDDF